MLCFACRSRAVAAGKQQQVWSAAVDHPGLAAASPTSQGEGTSPHLDVIQPPLGCGDWAGAGAAGGAGGLGLGLLHISCTAVPREVWHSLIRNETHDTPRAHTHACTHACTHTCMHTCTHACTHTANTPTPSTPPHAPIRTQTHPSPHTYKICAHMQIQYTHAPPPAHAHALQAWARAYACTRAHARAHMHAHVHKHTCTSGVCAASAAKHGRGGVGWGGVKRRP